MAAKEVRWTAPEFEYFHKGNFWYWLTVLAAGLLIIVSLWQRNVLFAIFIFIAEILFLRLGSQIPQQLDFRLSDLGIELGNKKHYRYEELSGFVTKRLDGHEEGASELILKRKHRLSTNIKILFPTKIWEELRLFINKHLPELEHEESLVEHIGKIIKF